jgi:hypothetical protein
MFIEGLNLSAFHNALTLKLAEIEPNAGFIGAYDHKTVKEVKAPALIHEINSFENFERYNDGTGRVTAIFRGSLYVLENSTKEKAALAVRNRALNLIYQLNNLEILSNTDPLIFEDAQPDNFKKEYDPYETIRIDFSFKSVVGGDPPAEYEINTIYIKFGKPFGLPEINNYQQFIPPAP